MLYWTFFSLSREIADRPEIRKMGDITTKIAGLYK